MSDATDATKKKISPYRFAALRPSARARNWNRESDAAEWAATDSPYGGLILQQRRRAGSANARAFWVLVMLVIVVFLGLAYYIVPDVRERFFDGRRAAAQEAIDLADADSRALNEARDALIVEMKQAVEFVVDRVDTDVAGSIRSITLVESTGTLIAIGANGAILRSTNTGASWILVNPGGKFELNRPVVLEGTNDLIVTGDTGTR